MPYVPGSIADHDIKKNNHCLKNQKSKTYISFRKICEYDKNSGPENLKISVGQKNLMKYKKINFTRFYLIRKKENFMRFHFPKVLGSFQLEIF